MPNSKKQQSSSPKHSPKLSASSVGDNNTSSLSNNNRVREREEEQEENGNKNNNSHQPVIPHNDANQHAPHAPTAQVVRVKAAPHLPHDQDAHQQPSNKSNLQTLFSPPIDVGTPAGDVFPANPLSNRNAAQKQTVLNTKGASPSKSALHIPDESTHIRTIHHHQLLPSKASPARASPRHSDGNNNNNTVSSAGNNNNTHVSVDGEQQQTNNNNNNNNTIIVTENNRETSTTSTNMGSRTTTEQQHDHFVERASTRLAAALAITKNTNNNPTVLPSSEKLTELARDIAEKLFAKGTDYAQTHFSDLVMALEDKDQEILRSKIRNGKVTPEEVANLKLMDLLTAAQKAYLEKEQQEGFKEKNMKDITRAVATIIKTEECPKCHTKEAAILESENIGGEPRFWSGGELEDQQELTLYKCLNCDNEWSKETKYTSAK